MAECTRLSQALKDDYERNGYVFVPGLVDDSELAMLRDACDRVVGKTRAGEWPHRRIVGKQFPPFVGDEPDSWGVQHIMHPDLGEPAFVRWYGSKGVVGAAMSLLECNEDQLEMGKSLYSAVAMYSLIGDLYLSIWCVLKSCLIFLLIRTDTNLLYAGTEMISPRLQRRKRKLQRSRPTFLVQVFPSPCDRGLFG